MSIISTEELIEELQDIFDVESYADILNHARVSSENGEYKSLYENEKIITARYLQQIISLQHIVVSLGKSVALLTEPKSNGFDLKGTPNE